MAKAKKPAGGGKPWKPRNGRPLLAEPQRGRLEILTIKLLKKAPKIFLHPLWAILVGLCFAIATSKNQLQFRSIGFILIAIWLAVDWWAWLLSKGVSPNNLRRWFSWKLAIGWVGTSIILLIGVAGTMWWGVSDAVDNQQQETFEKLSIDIEPQPSGDAADSVFTIRNNSRADISHSLVVCHVNFARYRSGLMFDKVTNRFISKPLLPMKAGGDAQSESCLTSFVGGDPLVCGDVTIEFKYVITQDPGSHKSKSFRFATHASHGLLSWYQESKEIERSSCEPSEFSLTPEDLSGYKVMTSCSQGCDYPVLQQAVLAVGCATILFADINSQFGEGHPSLKLSNPVLCEPKRQRILRQSTDPISDAKAFVAAGKHF